MAPIAMLDLAAQHAPIRDELDDAIARVIDGQQFILGDELAGFEAEFARYCGSGMALGCASGSDAILLALMALGVGPGDEVLVPAYSFVATASSVVRLGARPVFADIESHSFNLDPQDARIAADGCSRLKAILPVDLFGRVCEIPDLLDLAAEFGVPLVEDAAQSVGAVDGDQARAGSRATVGCFSVYPSKNLGAFGDGGIVTTSDPELADRIAALRSHGARAPYIHDLVGINSRLDTVQAAVLRVKLRHLEGWTKTRRENATFYDQAFRDAGAVPASQPFEAGRMPLRLPEAPLAPARHVYHHYVVRIPSSHRGALRAHLRTCGIGSEVYYPIGLHRQPCFAQLTPERYLPETEAAARESLALPVHPCLTANDLTRIVDAVVGFLGRIT
jgi:dTDP-4-amino-4,6-dideoxygalactose transaminase